MDLYLNDYVKCPAGHKCNLARQTVRDLYGKEITEF